jgi:hypothetical protein
MWEPQPLTTLRTSKACRGEKLYLFTDNTPGKGFIVLPEKWF